MAITYRTLFCYCFFQACLTAIFTNLPAARLYVYKDTLKLPLSQMSWMMTAAKAIDMLSSFVMGRLCDNAVTPWGRRKPFLILCWPIALIIIMALMLGAQVFSSTHETPPCSHLAADPQQLETCVTLKECYDAAIAAGLALPPDSERTMLGNSTRGQVTDGVPQYFFVLYFFYYTFLVAGSQVPFDALGQELTEEYDDRARLFMWKSVFSMLGAAVGSQLLLAVSSVYPDNLAHASVLTFVIMTVVNLLALVLLAWGVQERPLRTKASSKPFLVSLYRLFTTRQYRFYLVMRVPMTVLALLPYMTALYYVQNNMELESVASMFGSMQLNAIIGALLSAPLLSACASKFGRPLVLTCTLGVLGILFISSMFIPFHRFPALLYLIGPLMGVCVSIPYVLPDAMLGDIIDYDELLTGDRNEAMYSTVESNVQQFVDVVLGLATMVMAWVGFRNLSGCECGCGVSCKEKVGYEARWVCPSSIGYSCDGSPAAELFYQPEPEVAPCTVQNAEVRWVTSFFMFGLPGLCALLAIFPIRQAAISKQQHEVITKGIAVLKANPNGAFRDPITGKMVVRPHDNKTSLFVEQFTYWEWNLARHGMALHRLKAYLCGRLGMYVMACVILIVLNLSVGSDAIDTTLQISFWFVAILIVLIPIDALRLNSVLSQGRSNLLFHGPETEVSSNNVTPDRSIEGATVLQDCI